MIHSEHLFHIIFEMKTSPARNDSSRGFIFLVGEDPWTSCGAVLGRSHFDFRGLDPRDGRSPTTRRDRWTLSSHLQGSLLLCVGGPRDWKKRLKPSRCEKHQGFSSSFIHLWFFKVFLESPQILDMPKILMASISQLQPLSFKKAKTIPSQKARLPTTPKTSGGQKIGKIAMRKNGNFMKFWSFFNRTWPVRLWLRLWSVATPTMPRRHTFVLPMPWRRCSRRQRCRRWWPLFRRCRDWPVARWIERPWELCWSNEVTWGLALEIKAANGHLELFWFKFC